MNGFIPGDVVQFTWWSDLRRYIPKKVLQTVPNFEVTISRGEMGLVISVDDSTKEVLVLFSGSKLILVHSWMITLVIDRLEVCLL